MLFEIRLRHLSLTINPGCATRFIALWLGSMARSADMIQALAAIAYFWLKLARGRTAISSADGFEKRLSQKIRGCFARVSRGGSRKASPPNPHHFQCHRSAPCCTDRGNRSAHRGRRMSEHPHKRQAARFASPAQAQSAIFLCAQVH